MNGDGYGDVVIGAYNDSDAGAAAGSAYVYYGSALGVDVTTEEKLTYSGLEAYDYCGFSVSGVMRSPQRPVLATLGVPQAMMVGSESTIEGESSGKACMGSSSGAGGLLLAGLVGAGRRKRE